MKNTLQTHKILYILIQIIIIFIICGDLNENGPHRLREWQYLEVWLCWRKCVTGGKLWGFKCSSQDQRHSLPIASDADVEISAPSPSPCLSVCSLAAHHDDIALNLWTVNQPQLNVIVYKSSMVMVSLHSNRNSKTWLKASTKFWVICWSGLCSSVPLFFSL